MTVEAISNDIDVIVAAYDDVSNGRGTPAAQHERDISHIKPTDEITVEIEPEEEIVS